MRLKPSAPSPDGETAAAATDRAAAVTAATADAGASSRAPLWCRGTTSAWPPVQGKMSRNATVTSSACTIRAGARPATMAQKMQSSAIRPAPQPLHVAEHEIPPIQAVGTPVADHVALDGRIVVRPGREQMRPSAAVDAGD